MRGCRQGSETVPAASRSLPVESPRPGRGIRALLLGLGCLCLAALGGTATAEPRALAGSFATVDLPPSYQAAVAPAEAVALFRDPAAGYQVLILRFDLPSPLGWKDESGYFDDIEESLATATSGYRRVRRDSGLDGHVRRLDLIFSRRPGPGKEREFIATRWMFYRTFALAITASRIDSGAASKRDADRLRTLIRGAKRSGS